MNAPKSIEMGEVRATVVSGRPPKGDAWYWRARLSVPGPAGGDRRETVWTGWATRAEAIAAVAALIASGAVRERRSARAVERPDKVRDLAGLWLAHQQRRVAAGDLAPLSLVKYTRATDLWVAEIGDVLATRLTAAAADDVVLRWRAAGVALPTVRLQTAVLRMVTRWGHERGFCSDVRPGQVRGDAEEDRRYVSHTPSSADIWAVIDWLSPSPVADMLTVQAAVGARIGELLVARAGDVDLPRRQLALHGRDQVRGRAGKTGRRLVPLGPEAVSALARRIDAVGGDTTARLWPLDKSTPNNAIERATEALGLERFSTHGIRRRAVMALLGAGVDPATASRITGHSVQVMLSAYVRPDEEDLRGALAAAGLGQRPGQVLQLPRRAGHKHGAQEPEDG